MMRTPALLICAVLGGVAGSLLMRAFEEPGETVRENRDEGATTRLRAEVDELRESVARLRRESETAAEERARAAAPDVAAPETPGAAAGDTGAKPKKPAPLPPNIVEFLRLVKTKPFGSDDSNRLFGWLSKNKERIGDVINQLMAEIEEYPNNADLRVALATAWVAELTNNVTPGPQQGIVWSQASAAYDKAIELDPGHWQARFGKAFGISMAPEFLGVRPVAIKQFEELLTIQEQGAPEPQHAQTYFRLGTLYKDAGNMAKAREIWDKGLRLFPENTVLKGTLEASTKK